MRRGYPELRHIKSCRAFKSPEPFLRDGDPQVIRGNVALQLLGRIASGLAEAGFTVAKVKPAKGIEAGFSCLLNKFLDVDVRPWRPMLSVFSLSRRPSESQCAEQFQGLLCAIKGELA
jgi:hypothetical protein